MMDDDEFKKKVTLIEMQRENDLKKHQYKMEELAMEKRNNDSFFENQMSAHRLKRRDIMNQIEEKKKLYGGRS